MIFTENEGLPFGEVVTYHIEHAFNSYLGPLILCLSGRFDILEYFNWRYPMMGYNMFVLYMRWILTPVALITWANLNHCLCGTDSDPFWRLLGLDKYYWIIAEIYLGAITFLTFAINIAICYIVKRVICG